MPRLTQPVSPPESLKKIYQLTKNNVEEAVQFFIKKAEQGNIKVKIILYDLANKNVPQALNILIGMQRIKLTKLKTNWEKFL